MKWVVWYLCLMACFTITGYNAHSWASHPESAVYAVTTFITLGAALAILVTKPEP